MASASTGTSPYSTSTSPCPICAGDIPSGGFVAHLRVCKTREDAAVDASAATAGFPEPVRALFASAATSAMASLASVAAARAAQQAAVEEAPHPPTASATAPASTCTALVIVPTRFATASEDDAHLIVPGLYLGTEAAANDPSFLSARRIRSIVQCSFESPALLEADAVACGVTHHRRFPLQDTPFKSQARLIGEAIDGVAEAVAHATGASSAPAGDCSSSSSSGGGAVLVHCAAGVSRSATVVMGHLVRHGGMTLLDAAAVVRAHRPVAYPNVGFWMELVGIEAAARGGVNTVTREAVRALHASGHAVARLHARWTQGLGQEEAEAVAAGAASAASCGASGGACGGDAAAAAATTGAAVMPEPAGAAATAAAASAAAPPPPPLAS